MCYDCEKFGNVDIIHNLKLLPKYLFIACKRTTVYGRCMSGPPRRSNRPVIIQRYNNRCLAIQVI